MANGTAVRGRGLEHCCVVIYQVRTAYKHSQPNKQFSANVGTQDKVLPASSASVCDVALGVLGTYVACTALAMFSLGFVPLWMARCGWPRRPVFDPSHFASGEACPPVFPPSQLMGDSAQKDPSGGSHVSLTGQSCTANKRHSIPGPCRPRSCLAWVDRPGSRPFEPGE